MQAHRQGGVRTRLPALENMAFYFKLPINKSYDLNFLQL